MMYVSLQLSDTRVAEVQSCNKKAHEFGGEAHTALVHICADLSNAETFWEEATILKGDTEALKGDKLRSTGTYLSFLTNTTNTHRQRHHHPFSI